MPHIEGVRQEYAGQSDSKKAPKLQGWGWDSDERVAQGIKHSARAHRELRTNIVHKE